MKKILPTHKPHDGDISICVRNNKVFMVYVTQANDGSYRVYKEEWDYVAGEMLAVQDCGTYPALELAEDELDKVFLALTVNNKGSWKHGRPATAVRGSS